MQLDTKRPETVLNTHWQTHYGSKGLKLIQRTFEYKGTRVAVRLYPKLGDERCKAGNSTVECLSKALYSFGG
jgi:hypothetical protein